MKKMKILLIMSFFLAIGCGQKEKIKLAEQKSVSVQKPVQLKNQPKRFYAKICFFLTKMPKIKVLTYKLKTHIIPCIPKGGGYGVKRIKS